MSVKRARLGTPSTRHIVRPSVRERLTPGRGVSDPSAAHNIWLSGLLDKGGSAVGIYIPNRAVWDTVGEEFSIPRGNRSLSVLCVIDVALLDRE